jgi:RNA polymerase sigma-70 factor (ECF subfamily)
VNKETFRFLFDEYYNPLCNYVANSLGFKEEAEDIVMDVFTHIWAHPDTISEIKYPKTYLFKAVYHKSIEHIRSKKLVLVEYDYEKIVVPDYNEENIEEYLMKEKIFKSIRQLPSQCQLIFVKSKIDGLSHKAIAEELGLSTKTIENQITKAMKILKKLLMQ